LWGGFVWARLPPRAPRQAPALDTREEVA
jgi:hypothetical protein